MGALSRGELVLQGTDVQTDRRADDRCGSVPGCHLKKDTPFCENFSTFPTLPAKVPLTQGCPHIDDIMTVITSYNAGK